MAPVARELAQLKGVIEPLQTADSLHGQIEELETQLIDHADPPVTLIGSSWGAVLALFVAARNEVEVRKLILIGSAVFDAESSSRIEGIRLDRLNDEKRRRYESIVDNLKRASDDERNRLMNEWGELLFETDVYDPLTHDLEVIDTQYDIFSKVWPDFVALRDRPGFLKNEFSKIDVPTIVIHGEYDPHPIEGLRPFLESCLSNVSFHLLPECGHYPWIEKRARERFFEVLRNEI
jgi:pimeloyl-ACP methyl ester carboxylesterase